MSDAEIMQKAFDIVEKQSKLIEKIFSTFDSDILKAIRKEHDRLSEELKDLRKLQIGSRY